MRSNPFMKGLELLDRYRPYSRLFLFSKGDEWDSTEAAAPLKDHFTVYLKGKVAG